MSTKTALVPVADGTEEIEAVAIVDTLRRAEVDVTVAAVGPDRTVTCSRGVVLTADCSLADAAANRFDLIAVPGGMPGAEHLGADAVLTAMLIDQHRRGSLVAAICAAPALVLQPHGILDQRRATCHPAFFARLPATHRLEDRVVIDGHVITSRGPGTALEFALALVALLRGDAVRDGVAAPMLVAT